MASSYSPTRRWSKWEVMNQLLVQFEDVETFLNGNTDVCPSFNKKLIDTLQNSPKRTYFMLELALGEPT